MKELWSQIPQDATDKDKLQKLAQQVSNVIVDGAQATNTQTFEVIAVLDGFDPEAIVGLKRDGKQVALKITIKGKEDENNAVKAADLNADYIIIDCMDWRVIPLENLIAKTRGKSQLIAQVSNAQDAQLVLETLELGTDGVLLVTSDPEELNKTAAAIQNQTPTLEMATAKIILSKPIGTGARVCVDTCDLMVQGEGMLIGSQSAGLFLVEAEVHENPYVASRPFRVNAGSISMYTLGSLQNTRYLSELKAGDEVIIVNREGSTRTANVGRIKIEFRPLMLIEAQTPDGKVIKTILQNAETIRAVTPNGSTPVTQLKAGDEVIVHLAAKGGRHFGISVPDETVIEK
ncbi:MAG: 3-dehydroquinate synthase II [Candidatus Bathyarchaeota archaeon]|nr:3-dehydroquinate synthase II [Candidatus Bathyarchaeota archaeon]